MKPKIGFIGIGMMGHGMAKNLLEKGYQVVGVAHRNRDALDDLISKGATEAKSPKEAAQSADLIIICVTGAPQLEAVVYGENGLLAGVSGGMTVLDCSTGEAGTVEKVAVDLATKNVDMADAPLARTPVEAEAGKLNTMVGASDEVFEKVKPVLEAFCENIFHMGPLGSGTRMKLINNLITMGQAALIAEALCACKATGVNLQRFRDVISAGGGNSGIFQMVVPAILDDGSFDGMKFSIANATKDLSYLNKMMTDATVGTAMASATQNAFVHAGKNGFEKELVGSLVADQAAMNGVDIGKC